MDYVYREVAELKSEKVIPCIVLLDKGVYKMDNTMVTITAEEYRRLIEDSMVARTLHGIGYNLQEMEKRLHEHIEEVKNK